MANLSINELLKAKMKAVIDDCMGDSPAFCSATCPLHLDVKGYVGKIGEGEYNKALDIIRKDVPFPGILGRICAHPCEEKCKRGEDVCKGEKQPISIMALKRFAADYDNENTWNLDIEAEKEQKVAVVGAGPAGAMAAYLLRRKGYNVTIFEALPVVGGMLRVGIPSYRLPRNVIDFEYSILEKLGVEVKLNTKIGEDIPFSKLESDFDAVFVAVGAHKSFMMNLPGADLDGILPGTDFLRNASLGNPIEMGKKVTVIGGGNVAIDVARTAVRLGAEKVTLVCLEKCDEMPAHQWEVEEAKEEDIEVVNSFGVKSFRGEGQLNQIELMECSSVFDEDGKFNPQYNESNTKFINADTVVIAIGQTMINDFVEDKNLLAPNGKMQADQVTLQTANPKVFAGGDAVGRPLLAIEALAHGKKAAISIDRYFKGEDLAVDRDNEGTYETKLIKDFKDEDRGTVRKHMARISIERRKASFEEVELGFTEDQAKEEASRCLQCECKTCMKHCEMLNDFCEYPKQIMEKTMQDQGIEPLLAYSCNMCSQCTINCPREFKFAEIFMDIRKELVKSGDGPLPKHKPIKIHQTLGFSAAFNIVQPDLKAGFTKRVFMPGCALPSYNPEAVGGILKYLQEVLPGTGAVLKCCGKPTKALGQEKDFKERYSQLEAAFNQLGVDEIIVACQSCYDTVSTYSPDKKVISLYQVMMEHGIPEAAKGTGKGKKFALHDSCVTRNVSEIHDGVRYIMKEAGFEIEELENSRENTRCCGFGGMIVPANPDLAMRVMKRRTAEAKSDTIVTYCAACRESMVRGGKKGFHLMDLIFLPGCADKEAPGLGGPLNSWMNRYKSKLQIKKAHLKN
ncbi:MAG: pyridine nucleotide-disulfide oxidoreductase [Gracilibacter sp. BRH_c7a]|nr:MAG: pyridine nucleotide-disulfide oxidoreductase [Gracilibacter sp. BRH_c7a]